MGNVNSKHGSKLETCISRPFPVYLILTIPRAFNDRTYSDLTVITGGVTFHVHKVFLSVYTPYFTNATKHGFSETAKNVITMDHPSPHAVYRVLKYCYTGELCEHTPPELGQDDGPLMFPRIFALADMLCIDDLKEMVPKMLAGKFTEKFVVKDFLEIVREIYTTTNDTHKGIRKVLVDAAVSNLNVLVRSGDFKKLLDERGEFSSALVIAMHGKSPAMGGSKTSFLGFC
ncbi:BTB/POZ protein [Trichophaea hybrida]|nr:BTB/POZ protein [Trichophaea hybrida]